MAITSAAQVATAIAAGRQYKTSWNKAFSATTGVAATWYDTWTYGGMPSAGGWAGSLGTPVVPVGAPGASYTTGRISCGENVAGSGWNKHLFNAEFMTAAAATAMPMYLMLVDIVAYYPGIVMTTTTAQTINTPNTSVLTRYTSGAGLMCYLTYSTTVTTPATSTFTMNYTNSAGTGGRASPSQNISNTAGTGAIGALPLSGTLAVAGTYGPFINLQSGDSGVKIPYQVTIGTTQASGVGVIVQCYPLACIPIVAGPGTTVVATARDFLFSMPTMPKIVDGACLNFLLYTSGAVVASTNLWGMLDFVWG